MDIDKENDYEFDPLDATKTWPEDQFPLRPVGKMVLDRNVDNWFTDNEMVSCHWSFVWSNKDKLRTHASSCIS